MKETTPRLEIFRIYFPEWDSKIQTTIFGTLCLIRTIVKNSEAGLVINLNIWKNAQKKKKKNAEQTMPNKGMQIYLKFETSNCAFFA